MSAVLTIFYNILLAPLHPNAPGDLQLLKCSVRLLQRLRTGYPQQSMHIHMTRLEDLIAELGEVAEIAITKA